MEMAFLVKDDRDRTRKKMDMKLTRLTIHGQDFEMS